ncbi:MAG: hypothetical protein DLM61_07325 [Pseudonocardiales bacterium]|nr:MAG: hypothetical protein DLM61_07325 [Pseudonocardiales bacterium]
MLYRPPRDHQDSEPDDGGVRSWFQDLLDRFPTTVTVIVMTVAVLLAALAIYAIVTRKSTMCACGGGGLRVP